MWHPVPYYPKSPPGFPPLPKKLPHKLGFIPQYLKKRFKENEQN
jgi:hypothetical protein